MARHMGDVIRQLRSDAGMNLRELSRAANVDIASLSRIESHKQHLLARQNLIRVAQALGTTATELERLAGTNGARLPEGWPTVEEVIDRDPNLTTLQKKALKAVYQGYVRR